MNKFHPDVPDEICDPEWTPGCDALEELWGAILRELTDDKFSGRTHGNRRTYDAGCTGPMCKKSVREFARRRHGTGASNRYRYLDPVIELFAHEAAKEIALWKDRMLKALSAS